MQCIICAGVVVCWSPRLVSSSKKCREREMERSVSAGGEGEGEIRRLGESAGLILRSSNNPVPLWPTIDGPLGLSEEDSLSYARSFFKFGFLLLPWLWAVNCFYFWPVLRHSPSFPRIHRYVFGSALGFVMFTVLLSSWSLTFAVGGEHLFGPIWEQLVMYNVADRFGLTGWS